MRDRALAALPVIGRLVQRQRSTAESSDEDDVYQLLDGAIPIDVRRFFAWRLSPGPAGFSFLGAPHSFSVFFYAEDRWLLLSSQMAAIWTWCWNSTDATATSSGSIGRSSCVRAGPSLPIGPCTIPTRRRPTVPYRVFCCLIFFFYRVFRPKPFEALCVWVFASLPSGFTAFERVSLDKTSVGEFLFIVSKFACFYRVFTGFTGFYWVFTWIYWVFTGFYWVVLGCTGFYWV